MLAIIAILELLCYAFVVNIIEFCKKGPTQFTYFFS